MVNQFFPESASQLEMALFFWLCILHICVKGKQQEICDADDVVYLSNDTPIVILKHEDLINQIDSTKSIEIAFGRTGTGILFVKNIPNLQQKRLKLLTLSRTIAYLDPEIKDALKDKECFNIGLRPGKVYRLHPLCGGVSA